MSEEQPQGSAQEVQSEKSSAQEQAVSVKAYKQVSGDMHKYKTKAKELEMKMNELQAQIETQQKSKLEEEKRFEELYHKAEQEKAQLLNERTQEKQLFVNAVKKSALKTELGGTIRDEYLNLAPFHEIEVNEDGSLISETVRTVANKFRQEHPSLVPSSASGNINATAAPMNPSINSAPKSLSQMSLEEKTALLLKHKQNKLNQ